MAVLAKSTSTGGTSGSRRRRSAAAILSRSAFPRSALTDLPQTRSCRSRGRESTLRTTSCKAGYGHATWRALLDMARARRMSDTHSPRRPRQPSRGKCCRSLAGLSSRTPLFRPEGPLVSHGRPPSTRFGQGSIHDGVAVGLGRVRVGLGDAGGRLARQTLDFFLRSIVCGGPRHMAGGGCEGNGSREPVL